MSHTQRNLKCYDQDLSDVFEGVLIILEQAYDGVFLEQFGFVLTRQTPTVAAQNKENIQIVKRSLGFRGQNGQLNVGEASNFYLVSLTDEIKTNQAVMIGIVFETDLLKYRFKSDIRIGQRLRTRLLEYVRGNF